MSHIDRLENSIKVMTANYEHSVALLHTTPPSHCQDELRYRGNVMKARLIEMENRLDMLYSWSEVQGWASVVA